MSLIRLDGKRLQHITHWSDSPRPYVVSVDKVADIDKVLLLLDEPGDPQPEVEGDGGCSKASRGRAPGSSGGSVGQKRQPVGREAPRAGSRQIPRFCV